MLKGKIKAIHIKTPFKKLEVLKDNDLKLELVTRLRNPGISEEERQEVANRLIIGHVRLMVHLACKYASKNPREREEILDEALVGLVQAVHGLKRNNNDNPSAYIVVYVCGHIARFLKKKRRDEDPVVRYTLLKRQVITMRDVREIVDKVTESEYEHKVITMKMDGWLDREIGEQFGVSQQSVCKVRKRIGQRFLKLVEV